MRKLLLILAVLVLIQPVIALEHLTSDNFDQPDTSVNPEKAYYLPGDEISVSYKITPKTSDDRELIGGEQDNPRTYTFRTPLLNPSWTISINYYMGSTTQDYTGNEVRVDVKYFYLDEQRKGVRSIEVNLSGKLPDVDTRLENVAVINVTVEEADSDVLPPLVVKVVNKQKFSEDIQKVKSDTDSLKSDLDEAKVPYNQSDFDEIYSLLDDAQELVNTGKYIEADGKIELAEEKLEDLTSKAEKLKAETERDLVDNLLGEVYLNMSVTEVALSKVSNSKNYTAFVETYAELKSRYDNLKEEFDSAKQLINDEKYSEAYNKLSDLKPEVEKLLEDVNELKSKIEKESGKESGGFSLPFISITLPSLPFPPLYLAAAVVAAAGVVVAAVIVKRRRGRWDELR